MLEVIGQVAGMILALVLVLVLAWVLLRWMNKRLPGMGGGSMGRMIKVLDRFNVGKSGSLLLVRVQDKVLLIAMSEHNAEKLCEFDDPEGNIKPEELAQNPSFSSAFKDAVQKLGRKSNGGDDGGKEGRE